MTEAGRAVFLSYASQDAEAALRICEALRSAGIEVWFDQSELRGGDAWDKRSASRSATAPCSFRSSRHTRKRAPRAISAWSGAWPWNAPTSWAHEAFLLPVSVDGTPERDAASRSLF